MSAPDKIWAVYGRVYERKPETEGLGDEYIRKDVADAEKAEAVAQEREACAAIAEKEGDGPYAVKHIAASIRARGSELSD
jgi:hypothetical protein